MINLKKTFIARSIWKCILLATFAGLPLFAQAPCSTFVCDTTIIRDIMDSSGCDYNWYIKELC